MEIDLQRYKSRFYEHMCAALEIQEVKLCDQHEESIHLGEYSLTHSSAKEALARQGHLSAP